MELMTVGPREQAAREGNSAEVAQVEVAAAGEACGPPAVWAPEGEESARAKEVRNVEEVERDALWSPRRARCCWLIRR